MTNGYDQEIVDILFKKNYKLLRLASTFASTKMSNQELKHVFTCACCFADGVFEQYNGGDVIGAMYTAFKEFNNLIKSEDAMLPFIKTKDRMDTIWKKLIRDYEQNEMYTMDYIEQDRDSEIQLDIVKNILTDEEYEFLISYYSKNAQWISRELGISNNACRKRVSRLIKKVKNYVTKFDLKL